MGVFWSYYNVASLDFCNAESYIEKIEGIPSNSASPSEQWVITFQDNIKRYFPTVNKKGFCKFFIENFNIYDTDKITPLMNTDYNHDKDLLKAMLYEKKIYEKYISFFNQKNVSPNFINVISFTSTCSYDSLLNLLQSKLQISRRDLIEKNFNRNIKYIYNMIEDRPAIHETNQKKNIIPTRSEVGTLYKNLKFSILLLDGVEPLTLFSYIKNLDYGRNGATSIKKLWSIFFQIFVNLYLFSIIEMVHNDLHFGNIFVKVLPTTQLFNYVIDGKEYFLETDVLIYIYDFDRSFVSSLGKNELLEGSLCNYYFLCNEYARKDTISTFCGAHDLRDNISKIKYNVFLQELKQIIFIPEGQRRNFDDLCDLEKMKPLFLFCNSLKEIIEKIYVKINSTNISQFYVIDKITEQNTFFINRNLANESTYTKIGDQTIGYDLFDDSKKKYFEIIEYLKRVKSEKRKQSSEMGITRPQKRSKIGDGRRRKNISKKKKKSSVQKKSKKKYSQKRK